MCDKQQTDIPFIYQNDALNQSSCGKHIIRQNLRLIIFHLQLFSQKLTNLMMDDEEYEVLFSNEDYLKLTRQNQQLEAQLDTLKEEKTKMVEQMMTITNQHKKLVKLYNKMKQQINDISITGLAMVKTLLDHSQEKSMTSVAINTQETQKQPQLHKKTSQQMKQQTDWSIIDQKFLEQEIKRLEMVERLASEELLKKNLLITESQIFKQTLEEKNKTLSLYIQTLEQEKSELEKQLSQMKHFIEERVEENKKARSDLNSQLQRMEKSLIEKDKQICYERKKNFKFERQSQKVEIGDFREIVDKYFSTLVMQYMNMSYHQIKKDLNTVLLEQSKIIQKYIQDICEAYLHK